MKTWLIVNGLVLSMTAKTIETIQMKTLDCQQFACGTETNVKIFNPTISHDLFKQVIDMCM